MRHQWVVRLDYGLIIPWVRRREIHGEEAITAVAGPDKLVLRGPRLPIGDKHRHVDEFDVAAGESLTFSMTWIPSYERTPPSADAPILATIADDREWAARCHDDVPHADVVRRSLLTLRLMTHEQTGGIVAAPDHLAARGLRRRAQLGLPLLLAARRRPDHRVADRRRLHRRGAGSGGTGCCAPSPATPTTSRSCTPSTGRGTCPSTPSTTCPATRGPVRSGSATAPSSRSRPTSSAR